MRVDTFPVQKFEQTLLSTRATNYCECESAACIGQGFFLSTEGSILLSEKLPQYYFLVNKALLCRSVLFVKPKQTKPAHCQSKTIFHGHSKEFFENETNILSMSSNQDVGILMSTKEINCYIKNLIIVFTSKSLYLFLLQPKSPFFLTACASSYLTWNLYHGLSLSFLSLSQRLSLSPCLFMSSYLSHCQSKLLYPSLVSCKPLLQSVPLRTWLKSIHPHYQPEPGTSPSKPTAYRPSYSNAHVVSLLLDFE